MAELTNEMQIHMVRCLAVFMAPTDLVKEMKEVYGVDVSLPQVSYYNPLIRAGAELRQELKDEFEATRKQYRESADNIPIANKVWRLQELQRIRDNNLKNPVMVMNALEQAAKECGDSYTNKTKTEHSGPNGVPLPEQKAVTITVVDARKRADTQ